MIPTSKALHLPFIVFSSKCLRSNSLIDRVNNIHYLYNQQVEHILVAIAFLLSY